MTVTFLLKNLPEIAGQFISKKKGTIVQSRGYGMVVKQCASVNRYKIFDKRSVTRRIGNRTITNCYKDLPVKVNKEIYFVDPTSLVLNKFGSRRNCKHLPPVLLFKDIEDKLFKLTRKGRWIKAISKGQMINSSSEFPRYHVYNKLLAHGNKPKIPRIKLMDALQESMDVVDSISQMNEDERDAMKSVLERG